MTLATRHHIGELKAEYDRVRLAVEAVLLDSLERRAALAALGLSLEMALRGVAEQGGNE